MDIRRRSQAGSVAMAGLMVLAPHVGSAQGTGGAPAPPPPPRVESPVVEGGLITFRLDAPKASAVSLRSGEISYATRGPQQRFTSDEATGAWNFDAKPLMRGADGVWTLTIGPLPPGLYDYLFDVDGLVVIDPANPHVVGNVRGSRAVVEVPGPPDKPRVDEWREVPHGTVTAHWYESKVTGSRRRMHVYTPPGYDAGAPTRYPVLYLLHGNSGHDAQWMQLGRVNVIADNLVADGATVPMLIVMPDGHPERSPSGDVSPERRAQKEALFEDDLLKEVVPLVERSYRVAKDPEHRAIAGLSMGGRQSLAMGLRHGEFAWIGGFSSSLAAALALVPAAGEAAAAFNARTRLLWVRVGVDDFETLVKLNRQFDHRLKAAGVRHEYVETAGMHMWSVWREYLADFMPRLFQASLNELTPEEKAAGWRLLFDGRTTQGWRGFKAASTDKGPWVVEDGCLMRPAAGTGDAMRGGDLVTTDTFSDFDLRWEWRVGQKGNSGIKYFVTEERTRAIAHEYQMLDDVHYPDEANPLQQTAAFYDVLPPSRDKRLRPTGEWNQSRILVSGVHVEHWLNGQKVLEYELGSPQVVAGIARSKFKDVPGFGTKMKGHILLQDHDGGGVCFRNMKILSPPR